MFKTKREELIEINTTDAFNSSMKAKDVLVVIDGFIERLETKEKHKNIIQEINNVFSSWEIITMKPNPNQELWVQIPFEYEKINVTYSLIYRIKEYFKRKKWIPKRTIMCKMRAFSNVTIPATIPVNTDEWEQINNNNAKRILHIMKHLKHSIEYIVNKGFNTIGIFNKPNGVIAMNQSKLWFTEHKVPSNAAWVVESTIKTQTFYDLINNIHFKPKKE